MEARYLGVLLRASVTGGAFDVRGHLDELILELHRRLRCLAVVRGVLPDVAVMFYKGVIES